MNEIKGTMNGLIRQKRIMHQKLLVANDTIEALRAENARLEKAVIELTEENRLIGLQMDRFADEIERLREALKPFADLGMRQAPGSDGDTFIVNIPSAKAIRAARAALGETE